MTTWPLQRVCIVGAGAIGGFIGARLARLPELQVAALARGATRDALQAHGWRLRENGELLAAPALASDDAAALGPQDLVVIAVKGPALTSVARQLAPLLHERTIVMPAMNGVPWWFGVGVPALQGVTLEAVDPGGEVARAVALQRVLGCVVHASTATSEPGLVEHRKGHGLIVGEPGGGSTPRAQAVGALLARAGFETTVSPNVRYDIWYKLWGNMTVNPVSAITGAPTDRVMDDPLVRAFVSAAMREAATVGEHIGVAITQTPEDRHQVTRKLGSFKPSMLQDVEAGRPLELDALVGVVREIARRVGVATPNIDTLFGLARLFGRMHGLYPEEGAQA